MQRRTLAISGLIIIVIALSLSSLFFSGRPEGPLTANAIVDIEDTAPAIKEQVPTRGVHIIKVLGKDGFDVETLSLKAGEVVFFKNADPAQKDMVLALQKEEDRLFVNSEITPFGEDFRYVFREVGIYNYWTIGYGKRAKVVVR
jgi:plastocyanin